MTGKEKALFLAYPILWTFLRRLLLVLRKRLRRARLYAFAPLSSSSRRDRRRFDRSSLECSVPSVDADAPDRIGGGLHALRFFYLSSRQYGRLFARDAARMDHAAGRSGALACGTPSRANPSPFCLWKRLRANRPQERG